MVYLAWLQCLGAPRRELGLGFPPPAKKEFKKNEARVVVDHVTKMCPHMSREEQVIVRLNCGQPCIPDWRTAVGTTHSPQVTHPAPAPMVAPSSRGP